MLHPDDILDQARRKYPAFLRSLVTGEAFFPLDIRFGRPSPSTEWEKLRREITALAGRDYGFRIEWEEIQSRRWGRNRFPRRVWFECEEDFVGALSKRSEVDRFRARVRLTRECCPGLNAWLPANALQLLAYEAVWDDVLKVCNYFLEHPTPGLYARELPIDVETKFVERHESILRDLLDVLLPESGKREADRFEERFGLRYDEPLIRLRLLDAEIKVHLNIPVDDMSLPLSQFCALNWSGLTGLVAENKMSFLTLPKVPKGLGIWGGGGAAELLTRAPWLARCRLFYWGDVDVHGFHILSRLRRTFPEIVSVMMNEDTLQAMSKLVGKAKKASYEDVSGLSEEEHRTYQLVGSKSLLLEQERIPQAYAVREIQARVNKLGANDPADPGRPGHSS